MKLERKLFCIALFSVMLVGCEREEGNLSNKTRAAKTLNTDPLPNRWYSEAQVGGGKELFLRNCARCHKADASGTKDWKSVGPDGKYPPPPLNGTAHTWHHSMDILKRTISNGGVALGGVMPGFKTVLNNNEMDEVIAYFQSTWSEDVYNMWVKRNE